MSGAVTGPRLVALPAHRTDLGRVRAVASTIGGGWGEVVFASAPDGAEVGGQGARGRSRARE